MSEQYFSLYGSLSSSFEGEKNYIVATASEWDAGNAWNVNLNNGNGNNNNKTNTGFVRPVAAYQDYVYNTPTSFSMPQSPATRINGHLQTASNSP